MILVSFKWDTTYKGILFELGNDDGLYNPNEKFSTDDIDSDKQFYFNHEDDCY